jgi:hypothetical protein
MIQSIHSTRGARAALLLAVLAALTACGGDDAATPGDSATAAAAPAAAAGTAGPSAEAQLADVAEYELSMDKYDRFLTAQRNVMRTIGAMSPAEREALQARNAGNNNASIDDMVRNLEREPVMTAGVRDAGLSAREYIMITMALMQSSMAAGIQKMRPTDDPDSLARAMKANPANVKFLRDNEAELARKQSELQAEMKKLDPSSGATPPG